MKRSFFITSLNYFKRFVKNFFLKAIAKKGSAAYWSNHMVANENWSDSEQSIEYFHWRNEQYPGYIDLMPTSHADGLIVADYGCGPGNDLVGFHEFSKPAKLIGIDVSESALESAKSGLDLHDSSVEFVKVHEDSNIIPIDSEYVDLVHSSGVLHHVKNINLALSEIHRILKIGGKLQVMVYNYNSIWLHLYTAYVLQIERQVYSDLDVLEAFRKNTDGPDCPISHCYIPSEFLELVEEIGFEGVYKGASISLTEIALLPKRIDALKSLNLPRKHREFLSEITFDASGWPVYRDSVAGINACFEFVKT
ncbi:MAG: class I SAM-dependent methyltransferase [Woeseiaceae bacterium]